MKLDLEEKEQLLKCFFQLRFSWETPTIGNSNINRMSVLVYFHNAYMLYQRNLRWFTNVNLDGNAFCMFRDVTQHPWRWLGHHKECKKEGKNQEGKMTGHGEVDRGQRGQEDRFFSHPSIPPLQPEEACASVTPRDENTKTTKWAQKQKREKRISASVSYIQTSVHSINCVSSRKTLHKYHARGKTMQHSAATGHAITALLWKAI